MAELAQTAANVLQNTGTFLQPLKTAGESIDAGMPVYEDSTDGLYYKSKADAEATALCDGVALNSCAEGQPLIVKKYGGIDLGAVLTVGETYVVSDTTAGKIRPIGDLGSADWPVILGVATAADNLELSIVVPAIAKA